MLCYIIPLGGLAPANPPDRPVQQPPLGIWGGVAPPYPTHPIAPGGGGPVDPGWGYTPPVDPGYGRPVWGWGPGPGHGPPVYPSHGLPGGGGHPWLPGHGGGVYPSLPIYWPDKPTPEPTPPEGGWGPGGPPTKPSTPPEFIVVWIPGHGYVLRPVGGPPTKPVDPAEPK